MWELLQNPILQFNLENVGTTANHDFAVQFRKCGNYYKSRFCNSISKMWELLQITILQFNPEDVGTITKSDFTVQSRKCGNYYKSRFYSSILKMWELLLFLKRQNHLT
ncbi:hypothetical protein LEP1GSC074_0038 [Leptospira noguchii str. Hook]|nr:hypothetical protein LEP1GSC074_0038 [Leptospira noguchii str. Hook]